MEELKAQVDYIEMPETTGYTYLIEWVFDIGLSQASGFGEAPLAVSEIQAWGRGIDITHFEVMTIRDLSAAYISMKSKAEKPVCPRPFTPTSEIKKSQSKIDEVFASEKFKKRS